MADDTNRNDDTQGFDDIEDINPEEEMKRDEQLPEDNVTPFSPPSDVQDTIDNTQQETDSNIDPHERYDEGLASAAEVDPPEGTKAQEFDPFSSAAESGGIQEKDADTEEDEAQSI